MKEDSAIKFNLSENNDAKVETSSDEKEVSHSEQVFDISEDSISPVKEEEGRASSGTMKVFPIRKSVSIPATKPTPPPQQPATVIIPPSSEIPKTAPAPIAPPPPQPVAAPPKVETPIVVPLPKPEISTPAPTAPEPTKNVLDPNYVPPSEFAAQSIATVRPKIVIPDSLPEIPAFKGTLDQKPHSFTPLSANKPAEIPKPTSAPYIPSYTPPVSKPPISTTIPPPPQEIPKVPPAPILTDIPKPPAFLVKAVESVPLPSSPVKSIGSIPLKDISGQFAPNNRTMPGNPAAKTLGATPAPYIDGKIKVEESPELKNLRTYESDVAEALSHKNISVASIAIAESIKKEEAVYQPIQDTEISQVAESAPKNHPVFKMLLIVLIIIFIGGGVGGAYYLYSKSPLAPSPKTAPESITNSSGVVSINTEEVINIQGMDITAIRDRIAVAVNKPHSPGNIHELIFTNGQNRVTEIEMLTLMQINAPDILKRSLTNPWMLGIYTDEMGENDVFVAATTNFFQNTFAGMLQWENIIADDLKSYISSARGIVNDPPISSAVEVFGINSSTTTLVSQPPSSSIDQYFTLRGQFEDRIIMNKDVRVFRTTDRNILFLYSFINNSTLVFTTKEQTLVEILNRLEKRAFMR